MDHIKTFSGSHYTALLATNRVLAYKVIDEALASGIEPEKILFSIVIPTIEQMNTDFTVHGNITLSQHYICSKVASEVTDRLLPLFSTGALLFSAPLLVIFTA